MSNHAGSDTVKPIVSKPLFCRTMTIMNINVKWENVTMKDFIELSKEDLELFSSLLSDYLCHANNFGDNYLNTLQSKLIFAIHNTH
jgi:hypothetical protein